MGERDDNDEQHLGLPTTLGDDGAGVGIQAQGDSHDADPPSVEEQLAAMRQEMEQSKARYDGLQNLYSTTVAQLTAQRNGAPAQPNEPQLPSFDDLPDPVEKPAEFKRELGDRLTKFQQQSQQQFTQQLTQQTSRQSAADKLMSRFQTKYPDLAKREALLYGAFAQETNGLRERGVTDVYSAVSADMDGFVDKVAQRMNAELGIDGNNSGTQQRAGRTAGVSGGTRPATGSKNKGAVPLSFTDQLKKAQLESSLI